MMMRLQDFCSRHPWPKIKHFRWMIWRIENYYREHGGTCPFTSRFGKRILVDPDKFFAWVESKECYDINQALTAMDKLKKETKKNKDNSTCCEQLDFVAH